MAGLKDSMLYALGRARLTGSSKTVWNQKHEAARFVKELRGLGYGVQEWSNLTNKHIGAVVCRWKDDGLSAATIKTYLAAVRSVCKAFGNTRIHDANAEFGVANRVYITNQDKSVSDETYRNAITALDAKGADGKRAAVMLQYQRQFGLRLEESIKINPFRDVHGDLLHVHGGTKGGRPRWVPIRTAQQRETLQLAQASGFYPRMGHGLIPKGLREQQWRNQVYRLVRDVGMTRCREGTMHGLRHAYCHARYEELTGFNCPVKFTNIEAYEAQALEKAGPDWRNADEKARCTLREELGHGVGREDIDSQYLGRW